MNHITIIIYIIIIINTINILCDNDIDRNMVFDVNFKRTFMIDDVTKKFENITGQMIEVYYIKKKKKIISFLWYFIAFNIFF